MKVRGKGSIRICVGDGEFFYHLPNGEITVDIRQIFDAFLVKGPVALTEYVITYSPLPAEEKPILSDAKRLALAVIDNDEKTSLALADIVRESYLEDLNAQDETDRFVPRKELLRLLERFEYWAGMDGPGVCLVCGGNSLTGHENTCKLGMALGR